METAELTVHSVRVAEYNVREEMFEGKKHIVVPVIMMKEGVHCGSHGCIYHTPEELGHYTEAWNGVPVTIMHPSNAEGQNVSANSPEVLQTAVGRIFNCHYDNGLRAEAWLDLAKITESSPQALTYIRQGSVLDVSVGVFTDEEATPGEWQGEPYNSIARNYRPDHLALLPGVQGACSWSDGCGVRTNKKGGKMNDLLKSFKELAVKGYTVSLINNEEGFQEISNLLRAKLDAMDNDERVYYLEEVYADNFIYHVRQREGGSTLYKRGYSVSNGEVAFAENPTEVRKAVSYVTMMQRTKPPVKEELNINENQGGKKMNDVKLPCCEAKVDALIANKQTRFTASDREWLMTQESVVIDKLAPMEPVQVNLEEAAVETIKVFKATIKTMEDVEALVPEEFKEQFAAGAKLYTDHRKELVKGIMDNTSETWKEDDLNAMSTEMLEKVSKSIPAVHDYSGQGGSTVKINAGTVEPMLPPGVGVNNK